MSFFKTILNKIKNISSATKLEIYAPVDGFIESKEQIPDPAFTDGSLGEGLAIKPSNQEVCSPMNGNLTVAFHTGHAYVISDTKTQISVLLHLGVDTNNIDANLKPFESFVKQDDTVKVKDLLCHQNLDVIRQNAVSDLTVLLVQNENLENKKIEFIKKPGDPVKKGDLIMMVVDASHSS